MSGDVALRIRYCNHRQEVAWRTIGPSGVWFGKTRWHPEPQWHLRAYDYDKQDYRDFAMVDILAIEQAAAPRTEGQTA